MGLRLREGRTGLHLMKGRVGLLGEGRIRLHRIVRRRKPLHILFRRHFLRHEHSWDSAFWYVVVPELVCDFAVSSQEDQLIQEAISLEVA